MNTIGTSYPGSSYAAPAAAPARASARTAAAETPGSGRSAQPSADERAQIAKLKARDAEVRQHEQAHLAAAGGLAVSAASFTYQRGPDGVNYAVGGEVRIDTSRGNSPGDTLRRAEQIRAAALAPAQPSGQDRAVAAEAAQMAQQARLELAQQQAAEQAAATANPDRAGRNRIERFYATPDPPPNGLVSAYA